MGFVIDDPTTPKAAWAVKPCDLSGDAAFEPIDLRERPDLLGKSYEPLPAVAALSLLTEIGALVGWGYSFLQVRSLLGIRDES